MRVSLNHLCEHKFKHIFHDTLNPICNCGKDIETSSHYLLHCPDSLQERMTLMNTVRFIIQVYLFLLYGKKNLDNINNTSILNATIKHLTETKRFDAKLF